MSLPPPPANQPLQYAGFAPANPDISHLKLLSICHYVLGGLTLLFSLMFLFHIGIGIAILSGKFPTTGPAPMPDFMGLMFVVMGSVAILFCWTLGILQILSGRALARRQRRIFSMVVAGISCMSFPMGTTLAVFTFIVLARPSVVALYASAAQAARPPIG